MSRNISSTTGFTLLYCLLIPWLVQGCSAGSAGETGIAPKPERNISADRLQSLIRSAERAFVVVAFYPVGHEACRAVLPDLTSMETAPTGKANLVLVAVDAQEKPDPEIEKYLGSVGAFFPSFTVDDDPSGFVRNLDPMWDGEFPVSLLYRNNGTLVELIKGLPDQGEITLIVNREEKLGH